MVGALLCMLVKGQAPYPTAPPPAGNIVKLEYFFDSDPGQGNGKVINLTPGTDINNYSFNADLTGVANGIHRLYIRTMNVNSQWSLTNYSNAFDFYVIPVYPTAPAALPDITEAEYFIDVDPGQGNATKIALNGKDLANQSFPVNISGLSQGAHRLYVRTKDSYGKWSLTNFTLFDNISGPPYPTAPAPSAALVELEYFIDTDPGMGNGLKIPLSGLDVTGQQFAVNLTGLAQGVHRLYVRSRDVLNKYSLTNIILFDNTALTPYPDAPLPAPPIGQLEYFIDTDPGFGNGTAVTITSGTDINNYSFNVPLSGLSDGNHTLYIRSRQNPWSMTAYSSFTLSSPTPLTWLYVKAELRNQQGYITWGTAQESNTDRFEIEHSTDGRNFTKAGTVAAAGNSNVALHYDFTHLGLQSGMNYYRIKQIDKDGKYEYSKVMPLFNKTGVTNAVIAPNPASNMVHVIVPAGKYPKKIDVIDMSGRIAQSSSFTTEQQVYSVNVTKLQPGNYVVKLYYPSSTETLKVMVQK